MKLQFDFDSKYLRFGGRWGIEFGEEVEFIRNTDGDFEPADEDEEDCESGSCAEPLEYTGFGFGVANGKRRVSPTG